MQKYILGLTVWMNVHSIVVYNMLLFDIFAAANTEIFTFFYKRYQWTKKWQFFVNVIKVWKSGVFNHWPILWFRGHLLHKNIKNAISVTLVINMNAILDILRKIDGIRQNSREIQAYHGILLFLKWCIWSFISIL